VTNELKHALMTAILDRKPPPQNPTGLHSCGDFRFCGGNGTRHRSIRAVLQ
jgi:hypothetical protein